MERSTFPLIDDGVNSVLFCSEFVNFLKNKQVILKKRKNKKFSPNYTTINVGKINGGIAVNIIPKKCKIEFEIRDIPDFQTYTLLKEIKKFLFKLEKNMKKLNKKCFIEFEEQNEFPPLNTSDNQEIISLCLKNIKRIQ